MIESDSPGGARGRRVLLLVLGAICAVLGLVVIASLVEHSMYADKVLPGVEVDTLAVGGQTELSASDDVARLATDLERTPLKAKAGDRTFTADPAIIGFTVDVDKTVEQASEAGRSGNPLAMVASTVTRRFRPEKVDLVVKYDDTRLQGLLDGWSTVLTTGLVEGGLRFDGTTVVPIAPKPGTGLVRDEAQARLLGALRATERTDIELPVGQVMPQVDQAAVDRAAAQARALLATDHQIVAGLSPVTLTSTKLAPTLGTRIVENELELIIDPAKLKTALGAAFMQAEQPPVDATFAINSDNSVSVVPSKDGTVIDMNALAVDLLKNEKTIVAKVTKKHPVRDTAWAKKLGITKQVSSFTTEHPCCAPRVDNIHRAADVLNNTVVEPGKLFSLNDVLGPRTAEKGYVKAPILVEDGFGEDYGGGISQLTTTLYNAVFFGGYEDVEHAPHRFYITRYPMGREATINYPITDLKFRNDTTHGVLIRTNYSDEAITVTFYGDNDGRVVREENRKILKEVPITQNLVTCPAKPNEDPTNICATLAPGEQAEQQTGETGYDVTFERVIDQPGKPQYRKRYSVHYPMLPVRILVGAGPPPASSTTAGPGTTKPPGKTTTTKPATTPTTKKK
jgi:vancomycin resistance protein YoaR